jgi:hypothetical protein
VSLTIHPASEVWLAGVWSFAPPGDYTPETAPFLTWSVHPYPAFIIAEPVVLPLATSSCPAPRPCAVRLEVFAEPGHGLAVTAGDGPTRDLDFGALKVPEWRSLDLTAPPGRPVAVRLAPRGTAPVVVRRLAWAPVEEAVPLQSSAR